MTPDDASAASSPSPALPVEKHRLVACLEGNRIIQDFDPADISEYLKDPSSTLWLDLEDPGEAVGELLLEEFGFHPLAVEDALKGEQRPKIEEYKGYLFIVAYTLDVKNASGELAPLEVHAFVGANYLVTVHRGKVPSLDEAFERWSRGGAMLGEGVGFLAYTVFDTMVDAFFPKIDAIGYEVDDHQEQMFQHPEMDFVPDLLRLKRDIVQLRRVLAPMRDVFSFLLRHDVALFAPSSRAYFQNVYDHVIRLLDHLEVVRELSTGALEAYMTVLSNRLNITMKMLTVYTIGLAFLGALFGAWGMNVKVPFAEADHAFWWISGLALTGLATGVAWAKFRHWL